MQHIMDNFSKACTSFGLTISIKKTKVMFTPSPGEPYMEPNIFVNGQRLEVVDSFVYLGSTLSRDGSLDEEINTRISKASQSFGRLEKRVWSNTDLHLKTKLDVYVSCVLSTLLYSSETWTTYRRHLKNSWKDFIKDVYVEFSKYLGSLLHQTLQFLRKRICQV